MLSLLLVVVVVHITFAHCKQACSAHAAHAASLFACLSPCSWDVHYGACGTSAQWVMQTRQRFYMTHCMASMFLKIHTLFVYAHRGYVLHMPTRTIFKTAVMRVFYSGLYMFLHIILTCNYFYYILMCYNNQLYHRVVYSLYRLSIPLEFIVS